MCVPERGVLIAYRAVHLAVRLLLLSSARGVNMAGRFLASIVCVCLMCCFARGQTTAPATGPAMPEEIARAAVIAHIEAIQNLSASYTLNK